MKKDSGIRLLGRLIKDASNIKWQLLLVAFITLIAIGGSILGPYLLGLLTDSLYDLWSNGTVIESAKIIRLCLMLGLVYFLCRLAEYLRMFIMNNTVSKFYTCKFRIRISDKIRHLPVSYVDSTPNGEIISRMTSDVSDIGNSIHEIFNMIMNGVIELILITVVLFIINPLMALIVVIVVPISMVISSIIAAKSSKYFASARKARGELYAVMEESFTGFDTVKAYGIEKWEEGRLGAICDERRKQSLMGHFLSEGVLPVMTFFNNLVYVGLCFLGGYLAINGRISVGSVVAFILYAKLYSGPLESLANGFTMMQNTFTAARRIYKILDTEEESVEYEGNKLECSGDYAVEFRNVKFAYTEDKPIIKNLSFTAKKGQKIAIVGPTGGGKTTIVNLLMRFYDPQEGEILIDGKNIKEYSRASVREKFSMVLQDTWLFGGLIKDNIAYGTDNISLESVKEAAVKTHIDYLVESLPNGYDTEIKEDSDNISAGQKQLITIARAYIANHDMLILDEATSNVDTRTELYIQETMDNLMKDRTSFVIAHRLSTIVDADLILVINDGDIVEKGTHEELMKNDGLYKEIYESQYSLLK